MPPRITAGRLKGRVLRVPPAIRATAAKVRQAFFNILGSSIEGARVLDGFAGSGALGLEALSRGAVFVAFIEADAESALAIRDNLTRLGLDQERTSWRVVQLDIVRGLKALAGEGPFDVIFLDPPYRSDEEKKALKAIGEYAMLTPTGLVAVEHDRWTTLPQAIGRLQQQKQHRYGDTVLSFYARRLPGHL